MSARVSGVGLPGDLGVGLAARVMCRMRSLTAAYIAMSPLDSNAPVVTRTTGATIAEIALTAGSCTP